MRPACTVLRYHATPEQGKAADTATCPARDSLVARRRLKVVSCSFAASRLVSAWYALSAGSELFIRHRLFEACLIALDIKIKRFDPETYRNS